MGCEKDALCILVVDDVPDNLEIIRATLQAFGYHTDGARTGGEAMSILDERCNAGSSCPDLVIVDIDLPDMRGGTLGIKIREFYPALPFIYLTAFGRLPVFVDIAQAQGAPLLTKPVDAEILVAEIEKAVKNYEGRRVIGKPMRDSIPSVLRHSIDEVARARSTNGEA